MRRIPGLLVIISFLAASAAASAAGKAAEGTDAIITGIITFKDPDGTLAVMPGGKGKGRPVRVRQGTRILRNGKEIPFSELKVGEWIVAKPNREKTGLILTVLPAPPPKGPQARK
jgi:hypothetical protein